MNKLNQLTKIKILFDDPYLMVVDKPYGVVVNRSNTYTDQTVQDYVESLEYWKQLAGREDILTTEELGIEFLTRSGIVHRIDKETSGVLVVAKNPEVFFDIQTQFKERDIAKEYHALVLGKINDIKFEVNAPIARNPKNRTSMAIVKEGRPAKTVFILNKQLNISGIDISYITAMPYTGRTHQIRVHLAAIGNPVINDQIYCTKKQLDQTKDVFNRMMLHALSIEFIHPVTKKPLKILSELPTDFVDVI